MTEGAATFESPVPGALGRVLGSILESLGAEKVDRVWIFPPLVRGRREYGLVVVSGRTEDPSQRALYTARYSAELTGQGMNFESDISLEGSAPPDRLPRVMDGVVRRSDLQLGDPREIGIEGDQERLETLALAHGWEPRKETPEESS